MMPRQKKNRRVHPPPTPRVTSGASRPVTQTLGETPNSRATPVRTTETPPIINASNPTFQIDLTLMQTLLAQGIARTLDAYDVAQNENSENNRNGGGTPVINQKNCRPYTSISWVANPNPS